MLQGPDGPLPLVVVILQEDNSLLQSAQSYILQNQLLKRHRLCSEEHKRDKGGSCNSSNTNTTGAMQQLQLVSILI